MHHPTPKTLLRAAFAASFLAFTAWSRPSAAQGATPSASGGTLNDPTIAAIFDAANTWDIETGGLAADRGRTKDVRAFGAMLVRDHHAVRQQGRDLLKKLKVHPTPPKDFAMAKDHETAMKSLRKLHGAAFDRAFLAHEVAYHKAVIDAVTTTLLPAIQNAELKDLVTKVAPAFQAHMAKAQSLLDAYPK
jgi:putative membrane protein